jgi:hypothetical protein
VKNEVFLLPFYEYFLSSSSSFALFFFCLWRLKKFLSNPHTTFIFVFSITQATKESIFFTTQVKGGQRDAYINTQRARNKIRGPTQTRKRHTDLERELRERKRERERFKKREKKKSRGLFFFSKRRRRRRK